MLQDEFVEDREHDGAEKEADGTHTVWARQQPTE